MIWVYAKVNFREYFNIRKTVYEILNKNATWGLQYLNKDNEKLLQVLTQSKMLIYS